MRVRVRACVCACVRACVLSYIMYAGYSVFCAFCYRRNTLESSP